MIIEFTIGNFLSFKNETTISFMAAKDDQFLDDNTFQLYEDTNLLKNIALWGPNASGKSNLLRALGFFKYFIINSSKESQLKEKIGVNSFRLSTETEKKPSLFEIIFYHKKVRYRYGFEATTQRVVTEWLFGSYTKKESNLFIRKKNKIDIGLKFKEGKNLIDKTRENALFLSVVAQFNGEIASEILKWFYNLNILFGPAKKNERISTEMLENRFGQEKKRKLIELIKLSDLDIQDIYAKTTEMDYKDFRKTLPLEIRQLNLFDKLDKNKPILAKSIKTSHKKYDNNNKFISMEEFDLGIDESGGTQKFFALAGPIIDSLISGKVLFIDEIEVNIHPLLLRKIIKLFNSKITNPKNAQLYFTTHNTGLLNSSLFRRDQISFIEKDEFGSSEVFSLIEFKKGRERKDASFEKKYLLGEYGAVPYLRDFENLFK
jgi:uncharacterized protein